MDENRPHPKNVPGPFYVVDGCCTGCDVPFVEAPGLFAYDGKNHCFVKRQPGTKVEINRMLRVAWAAELQCIRYRGDDPEILRRFAELGEPQLCDIAPPPGIKCLFRSYVTFDSVDPAAESMTPAQLVAAFQNHLRALHQEWLCYRFTPTIEGEMTAAFSYSWFEDNFHPIEVRSINLRDCRWLIWHSPIEKAGSRGVSNQLDDWLKSDRRFCCIRWYTQEQWNGLRQWQETPW